jgi:hypothetical protein
MYRYIYICACVCGTPQKYYVFAFSIGLYSVFRLCLDVILKALFWGLSGGYHTYQDMHR